MIEELQRFIQVAKNGNITQTAQKIFITQSALSQSIQRLEKQLKTKLFIQKGKTLQLTTDGLAVVQLGTKILTLWENAKDVKIRQSYQSTYTIGAFDNAALRLGKYFQQTNQDKKIQLELVIDTSEKLLSQLRLGILDVAICVIDPKQKIHADLLLIHNFSEKLIPVAAQKIKGKTTKIPFILYNKHSHTRNQIDEIFFQYSLQPTIFAESTSVTFMKELALLGCGVALLPENEIRSELKQKTLRKYLLPFTIKRTFGIYIRRTGTVQKDHSIIQDLLYNLK